MRKFLIIAGVLAIALNAVAGTLSENDRLNRIDRRKHGDVIIQRIPAIEAKRNYCVPASVEMILRYHGAQINQRKLGRLFDSSHQDGTSLDNLAGGFGKGKLEGFTCAGIYALTQDEYTLMVNAYLSSPDLSRKAKKKFHKQLLKEHAFDLIDLRLCTRELLAVRKPARQALLDACEKYIDKGYPLLWSVIMNFDPHDRNTGFHCRVIAGYKKVDGVITEIIYLDPWYGRRKFKRCTFDEAVLQTKCLHIIVPVK